MTNELKAMQLAAKAAGEILRGYFGQSLEVTEKSTAADFRTKADLEAEAAILTVLDQEFSHYNIQSEETGYIDRQSEYTFAIDPLDGTNNFLLGIPNFSVSIALLHNEEIIAGLIYQPILDHTYSAARNQGAYSDNSLLKVSGETLLSRSTIAHACGYETPPHIQYDLSKMLVNKGLKRLLMSWSVATDIALLAAGKIEGIIINGAELYDFAAGKLIAKEAGAIFKAFDGKPDTDRNAFFFATNNQAIHDELLPLIKQQKELG